MNYQTKNRLGVAVVVFLAIVVIVAAVMSEIAGKTAPTLGQLHAQQR
ncbi:hypothetical protein QZM25_28570 [Burkholderia contaminans]|nr:MULTISPECIES: hypothetical protein [Burkholderia cepacia complex]MCA7888801.1 hypothetical protein [Burkholderia contaminans]MDN7576573.1 hypothetical protein [Burkholderia contaminans]MDN7669880.1 hypothetical protein [Burkholderia vietnamiensis]MDN7901421.1 hypothetical protein [Burkholderia cepacia]